MKRILFVFLFLVVIFCTLSPSSQAREGTLLQVGMVGSMDLGDPSDGPNLKLGPGAFAAAGYIFGILGVRGSFLFASMDSEGNSPNFGLGSELWGGTVDLLIYPFNTAENQDSIFQPYFVVGVGGYLLENQTLFPTSAEGIGGNIGAGFDVHILERLTIGFENNYRPMAFWQSSPNGFFGTNSFGKQFYTFMGTIGLHF